MAITVKLARVAGRKFQVRSKPGITVTREERRRWVVRIDGLFVTSHSRFRFAAKDALSY